MRNIDARAVHADHVVTVGNMTSARLRDGIPGIGHGLSVMAGTLDAVPRRALLRS
jgi:hypothetical protein